MLKILNKREKAILFITVTIFIMAAAFNFLFAPIFDRLEELNSGIRMANSKLMRYKELLAEKANIQDRVKKYNTDLKNNAQKQDKIMAVLAELEGVSRNANIRIIDVRPQSLFSEAGSKEIVIDLRLEGQMPGFMKFIYDLENSLSLLRIKKLQLSPSVNSAGLEGAFTIYQVNLKE